MSIHEQVSQGNVAIRAAHHLGALRASDIDHDLAERIVRDPPPGWDLLTEIVEEMDASYGNYPDALFEFLADRPDRWLLEVATPVASRFSEDGTSYMFSWGLSYEGWVEGDTFEEAVAAAVQWAEGLREADRAREAA